MGGRSVRVRLDHHQRGVAVATVGDEELSSVDHVLVPVTCRDGLNGGNVAAGVGFRQAQRASNFAAGHAGKPPALLLLRAEVRQHVRHDGVGAQNAGDAHPSLRKFLEDHGEGGMVQAQPAILLRHCDAEKSQRLHLLDKLMGKGVVPVMDGGLLRYLPAYEFPHKGQNLVGWSLWTLFHPASSPCMDLADDENQPAHYITAPPNASETLVDVETQAEVCWPITPKESDAGLFSSPYLSR